MGSKPPIVTSTTVYLGGGRGNITRFKWEQRHLGEPAWQVALWGQDPLKRDIDDPPPWKQPAERQLDRPKPEGQASFWRELLTFAHGTGFGFATAGFTQGVLSMVGDWLGFGARSTLIKLSAAGATAGIIAAVPTGSWGWGFALGAGIQGYRAYRGVQRTLSNAYEAATRAGRGVLATNPLTGGGYNIVRTVSAVSGNVELASNVASATLATNPLTAGGHNLLRSSSSFVFPGPLLWP